MLPVNIDEITAEHVASLVDNKVSERKVLEYKERLPEAADGAKKEFLGDVTSFANSSGGDIIYGIRDQRDSNGKPTGIPEEVVGLSGINVSAEIARLESVMRDGIRPRMRTRSPTRSISPDNGQTYRSGSSAPAKARLP